MQIKQFYQHSQTEVLDLLRDFIESEFFAQHPEYRSKLSLIITGSVSLGQYDRYSDMDVEFAFAEEKDRIALDVLVKTYKKSLKKREIPIQFHPSKTFDEIREHHVSGWKNDDSLREYATALIVFDPQGLFFALQQKIKWYPRDVYKEKLCWLYAEAVFTFVDRFAIAKKRADVYYAEAMKLHVIRLLGNAILMLQKEYPSFDKHLHKRLSTLKSEVKFVRLFDQALISHDMTKTEKALKQLLSLVEAKLIAKKIVSKKDQQYWIDLRPKYQVEIISR